MLYQFQVSSKMIQLYIYRCIYMYVYIQVYVCVCVCVYIYIYLPFFKSLFSCLPLTGETWVRSLGQKDSLKKGMATHSSILAWRIPWTEEPGGLQFIGLKESDTHTHTGHCRVLSRIPCAMQQFLSNYLYKVVCICQPPSPNLCPLLPYPGSKKQVCFLHLNSYFCFVDVSFVPFFFFLRFHILGYFLRLTFTLCKNI